MNNIANSMENLTIEYVKIYQKIYTVRQDIFDSLNIFNGKGSIQCSTEQSDFKLIAQGIKKQSNYLRKDMSLVRMFEETLNDCKKQLLAFEAVYSRQMMTAKFMAKADGQLSEKRSVLLSYFEMNENNNNNLNKSFSVSPNKENIQIEITLAN